MFRAPRMRILGPARSRTCLTVASGPGLELFDEAGVDLDPEDHPVLVALRRGRRVDGAVVGSPVRRRRRPAGSGSTPSPSRARRRGRPGRSGTFSDITGPSAAGLRPAPGGGVPAGAARHPRRGDRGLRRPGPDDDLQPGRPPPPRPRRRVEPIGRVPSSRMLRHADGTPIDPEENPLLLAMAGERLHNVEIVLAPPEGEPAQGQRQRPGPGRRGRLEARRRRRHARRDRAEAQRGAPGRPGPPRPADRTGQPHAAGHPDARGGRTGSPTSTRPSDDGRHRGSRRLDRARPEHPGIAVYLLDLDNFKEVNDEFGHDVGDDLLIAVARRLSAIVRPTDTVARLGGDEFVVVCEIESGEEEMLRISRRISSALARPYRIDGRTLVAEASVGGVFVDDPDTDPSQAAQPGRRRHVRRQVEPASAAPPDDGLNRRWRPGPGSPGGCGWPWSAPTACPARGGPGPGPRPRP